MEDERNIDEVIETAVDIGSLLEKPGNGLESYLDRINEIDARLRVLADVRAKAIAALATRQTRYDQLDGDFSDLQVKTEQYLHDIDADDENTEQLLMERVAAVKTQLEASVSKLEKLNAWLASISGARASLVHRRRELVRIMNVTLNSDMPRST